MHDRWRSSGGFVNAWQEEWRKIGKMSPKTRLSTGAMDRGNRAVKSRGGISGDLSHACPCWRGFIVQKKSKFLQETNRGAIDVQKCGNNKVWRLRPLFLNSSDPDVRAHQARRVLLCINKQKLQKQAGEHSRGFSLFTTQSSKYNITIV